MTDSLKPTSPPGQSALAPEQLSESVRAHDAAPTDFVAELAQRLEQSTQANFVQSIRAHSAPDLQAVAKLLDQHFLYADLMEAPSKHAVLTEIGQQFLFPSYFGKNLDALYDCLTSSLMGAGKQTGFLIVLEHIPTCAKFDKEVREQLLDVFRDAAEFWAEKKVPFRCFYSFY